MHGKNISTREIGKNKILCPLMKVPKVPLFNSSEPDKLFKFLDKN